MGGGAGAGPFPKHEDFWDDYDESMHEIVTILAAAIKNQKPVEFEYIQEDKPLGKRIGNPYAVFEGTRQDGTEKVYAHIVQTAGVSDTIKLFPQWRMFFVDRISNIRVLEDQPTFTIDEKYNPNWEPYSRAIAKI